MSVKENKVKQPSKFLFATEFGRAFVEYSIFHLGKPILNRLNKGDGHTVFVLPGFLTTDSSTIPLRNFLNELGYNALPWNQGRNLGHSRYVFTMLQHIHEYAERSGEKVSLIGWSLGGVYAREIARQNPEIVRQVITMGSPFRGIKESNNVSWMYTLLTGKDVKDIDEDWVAQMDQPPPVPSTAIYSKYDGVVSWQHCAELHEGPMTENIEVIGSHCGLGHHPAVLACIADRLAQDPDNWQLFNPGFLQQYLYPYYTGKKGAFSAVMI